MDPDIAHNQPIVDQNIIPDQPDIKDFGDVANFVQTLLLQVQDKFQVMSDQILNRIDEMGNRINDLEKNLNEVIQKSGISDEVLTSGSVSTEQPHQLTKSNSIETDKPSKSSC